MGSQQSQNVNSLLSTVSLGLINPNRSKIANFEYVFSLVCLSQLDEIRSFFEENLDPRNETKMKRMAKEFIEQEDEAKANGMTLLMYAAFYGKTKICRYFLRFDPDLNHLDADNRNVLYHAVRGGYVDCVKLLLNHSQTIWINKPTVSTRTTMLLEAVRNDRKEICKLLLSRNANPSIPDVDNVSALHAVVDKMDMEMIRLMLEAIGSQCGKKNLIAAINAPDKWGWTPMHLAATRNDPALLKLLIGRGGEVHLRDGCGQTPLDWARETKASASVDTLKNRPKPQQQQQRRETNQNEKSPTQASFNLSELQDLPFELLFG